MLPSRTHGRCSRGGGQRARAHLCDKPGVLLVPLAALPTCFREHGSAHHAPQMILELAAPALELRKFLLSLLAAAAASWARRPELMTERSCSSCCDAERSKRRGIYTPFPDKNGDCDHKWRFLPFFEFLGVRRGRVCDSPLLGPWSKNHTEKWLLPKPRLLLSLREY